MCDLIVFWSVGVANAALWDRGGGLIYDDVLDITWLQDANYAGTTINWADQLVYQGYEDWRLPSTSGTESGYVNEGEMGHLYYDDGVTYFSPAPFSNVQRNYYWSGTKYAANPVNAWCFGIFNGLQGSLYKDSLTNAWAVRPGDSAPIPIPGTMLLLGSGLAGLGLYRKRMGRTHG